MKMKSKISIKGYKLILTCDACPEQYDVFKLKKQVGYIRLRWGNFSVESPDCGGEEVYYHRFIDEIGGFEDNEERLLYLKLAIKAIDNYLKTGIKNVV